MAALTPATMVRNSYVDFSPTALTSDGGTFTFDMPVDDKFFIYCELTSTTNGNDLIFTVSASTSPVAWQRGAGALTVTMSSTGKTAAYRALIGPIETARFMGSTGQITVTVTSSGSPTGFIGVAKMPYVVYS